MDDRPAHEGQRSRPWAAPGVALLALIAAATLQPSIGAGAQRTAPQRAAQTRAVQPGTGRQRERLAQAQTPPSEAVPGGEATVYNIELIVFRATTALGGAEDWSAEAGARDVAGDESASGSRQVGHFVAALPPSAWRLTQLEARLRTSGVYVPVAHAAWSQTASAWGTRAGFAVQRLGIEVPGLTGTVFLERGQFLHLGMTLTYAMPAPPAGLGAAPGTPFTIDETRRVRFYERNYYDQPAFGVIAMATPAQGTRPPGR